MMLLNDVTKTPAKKISNRVNTDLHSKTLKAKYFLGIILTFAICNLQFAISAESPSIPEGMVLIPASEFIMGSDKTEIENIIINSDGKAKWYSDEAPRRKISLTSFYIDIHEVTNADYKKFDPNHSFPSESKST